MGKTLFDRWWEVMAENQNKILDTSKTAFSFFSLKTKIIIIGVAVFILIVVIFPVVAIMSVFSDNNSQSNIKQGESSSTTIIVNEVIPIDNLKQYVGAVFPMPFETWNPNRDVVTSKYKPSRTITVNRNNRN